MKTYTLKQISELTGLTVKQVDYRLKVLGIKSNPKKHVEEEEEQKVIYYKSTETFVIYPSKMNYEEIDISVYL